MMIHMEMRIKNVCLQFEVILSHQSYTVQQPVTPAAAPLPSRAEEVYSVYVIIRHMFL